MAREIPEEITKENIKNEAISRLRDLGLSEEVIKNYENGKLMVSDIDGLYTFDSWEGKGMPELAIKSAERLHIHPYHIVYTYSDLGELYDVLYVSSFPDDWTYERVDEKGYLMSYCYNADEPDFSEIGTIRLNLKNETITREE